MFAFSEIRFKLCALFTAYSKSKFIKRVRNGQNKKRRRNLRCEGGKEGEDNRAIRHVNSMIDKVFSLYVDISVIDEKQRS